MAFAFNHSLASRASVSVVTSLWYHEDLEPLKSIDKCDEEDDASLMESPFDQSRYNVDSDRHIHVVKIFEKVKQRVSELLIPESVKRYLLEFVQIIGENLENWTAGHYQEPQRILTVYGIECFLSREFFDIVNLIKIKKDTGNSEQSKSNASIDVDLRKVLRWSPDGEIDLEQTGEALVQNESDPIKRFRLACDYCKEEEVMRLWPSVKTHFSRIQDWDSNESYQVSSLFWWRYFHNFWPESTSTYLCQLRAARSIVGECLILDELCFSCFYSFRNCCSPLALYLFKKCNFADEEFLNIAGSEEFIADKRSGTIFFRMPESFRVHILRAFPEKTFKLLLFWRHQSFFVDEVERSWDVFDEELFKSILFHIVWGVLWYADSDIYKGIFLRYWTGSPDHLRDVERVLYDMRVAGGPTLGHFADRLFGHSPAAEDQMKRVLFEGKHVLELATHVRTRVVLSDLIRTCLPEEEWEEKLALL